MFGGPLDEHAYSLVVGYAPFWQAEEAGFPLTHALDDRKGVHEAGDEAHACGDADHGCLILALAIPQQLVGALGGGCWRHRDQHGHHEGDPPHRLALPPSQGGHRSRQTPRLAARPA